MTFDINRMFKLLLFTWRDYDGESFKSVGFMGSFLPYLWYRFWWFASIYNIARYSILAILSPRERVVLEFYLGNISL